MRSEGLAPPFDREQILGRVKVAERGETTLYERALLAEVARLEQERDEARGVQWGDLSSSMAERERAERAEAALAVARKREQRAVSRLEQQLDEAVGRWHDAPYEAPPLHEWLGLTWMEYALYVQSGVAALVDEPAAATTLNRARRRALKYGSGTEAQLDDSIRQGG